jgi:hypothetical protein
VSATATATGKKIATTGMSRVPSPKPEKRVSNEARKAVITMIAVIISFLF